jgi:large subunit ribosomal protein L6
MSRIGKYPVPVPSGVTVQIDGRTVNAKGKVGQLSLTLDDEVEVEMKDNQVWVKPTEESKRAKMVWGMSRNLIRNMVHGVEKGYEINLDVIGVGYRAAVQGNTLNLQLGFSHDVAFPIPEGITIKCARPTQITVSGADRQQVGQVAANIRAFRKPEPYKGKGIKYEDEVVRRKEGKKK